MTEPLPVTIVTGTRKGIGKFLAHHYVGLGHIVVGCSRRDPDWRLDGYHHVRADVRAEDDVRNVVAFASSNFGRLDHLINNAGIASMNHALLTPLQTVNDVLTTNVSGTFLFCREGARVMRRTKFGRIVNFATVATPLKLEGEAIYAASKSAVISLTQILAREFAPFGVTVNAIGPTPIDTDLVRNVPADKMQALVGRQAIQRMGTFEDVSNVTDFFLRPASSFVTGQCVFLGGV